MTATNRSTWALFAGFALGMALPLFATLLAACRCSTPGDGAARLLYDDDSLEPEMKYRLRP